MKRSILFLFILFHFQLELSLGQEALPYTIFKSNGKSISYEKMLKSLEDADIVFFGELHNNTINHWLELQVFKSLYQKHHSNLALGLEMLESDNQLIVDEYLDGTIQERHFLKEAKLWNNYKTDYHPIVDFAFRNQLKVIATNIPQRYSNLVYREGLSALDSISDIGKSYIAPLPIEVDLTLPGYSAMMQSIGGHGIAQKGSEAHLAHAQAVKDASRPEWRKQCAQWYHLPHREIACL